MTIDYCPTVFVQIVLDVLPIKLWMTMKMSILWFQKLHRAFHWFVPSVWHCLAIDLDCYRPQFLQNLCKNFHDPQKKMGQWSGRLWGSSIIFLLQVFKFTFHPSNCIQWVLFCQVSLDTDGDDVDDSGGGGIKISVKNAWRCTAQFVQLDPQKVMGIGCWCRFLVSVALLGRRGPIDQHRTSIQAVSSEL